ncbi:Ion channel [Modestobacter sp. DSM 44400]|uniref:potassium channel family protein n=1 Tax=Modestobacter sp. DSM 44400 TaxID=1550230 RepID=UPI00089A03A9|nr:potassium channel family protein [Modestobacter sp. DSM 44400]SDX90416.1 Ion channel [Modestobacter sp. DSM 44400]
MFGTVARELAGVALVVLVLADVLATTLTLGEGSGPLTRRFLGRAWRVMLHLHGHRRSSRLLTNAGSLLLATTVLIWVVVFWAGWWLVFLGGGAIHQASTGAPASVFDVAYYAGFSVSTLGVGDFVADAPTWRLLTSVASFSGLVVITLAITYLLSVVSAVVSRRALATRIHALGDSAGDIVARGWDGENFSPLFVQQLLNLPQELAAVAEQHLAYPVLQYFRSRYAATSAPLAFARLDDAMLLLEAAVAASARPSSVAVAPVRRVINRYVQTAGATSAIRRSEPPPPSPALHALVEAGIPLGDPADLDRRVAADRTRRQKLRQLVHGDGRSWDG